MSHIYNIEIKVGENELITSQETLHDVLAQVAWLTSEQISNEEFVQAAARVIEFPRLYTYSDKVYDDWN